MQLSFNIDSTCSRILSTANNYITSINLGGTIIAGANYNGLLTQIYC